VLASKLFPEEFFDFIYLDARHNYEGIKEDLHAWYPKLKQGGLFAGHDFLMPTSKRVSLRSREQCSNLLTSSDFEIDCMKRKIAGRVGISSNLIGRHHTQTALVRRQDGSHGPFYPNLEFLLINQPSFFILFLFVVSYFNTLPLPSHSPLARLFPSLEIFLFSSNHPFITPEIWSTRNQLCVFGPRAGIPQIQRDRELRYQLLQRPISVIVVHAKAFPWHVADTNMCNLLF